jgi:serpin B
VRKKLFVFFAAALTLLTGCTNAYKPAKLSVSNLLDGMTANTVDARTADKAFIDAAANFSLSLFNEACKEGNTLLSPLSVYIALSMTANGAAQNTLTEMETVLGGGMPIAQVNEYLHSYLSALPSEDKSKLNVANSIWFRDSQITVKPEFLQTNKDYYNAASYSAPFNGQTLKDINNWVKNNTEGLIEKIIDKIDSGHLMFLINTVLFDAEWQKLYEKQAVRDDIFHERDGAEKTVKFMNSAETNYINDSSGAAGFIKPYSGNNYSFAAILPPENTDVYSYAASLNGTDFLALVENRKQATVNASIPKFSYECLFTLNDALQALGIKTAFSNAADFSKLGTSPAGNIFINETVQKTYIRIDEKGTKAGAVTGVAMGPTSAAPTNIYNVKLDRPFLYSIIDNSTNIPVFIGICSSV